MPECVLGVRVSAQLCRREDAGNHTAKPHTLATPLQPTKQAESSDEIKVAIHSYIRKLLGTDSETSARLLVNQYLGSG